MLVPCKECGNEISDKAYACPHCGNPNLKSKLKNAVTLGISKAKNSDVSAKAKDASAKFKIPSNAALEEHYKKVDYRNEWMKVAKLVGCLIIPFCVGILIWKLYT